MFLFSSTLSLPHLFHVHVDFISCSILSFVVVKSGVYVFLKPFLSIYVIVSGFAIVFKRPFFSISSKKNSSELPWYFMPLYSFIFGYHVLFLFFVSTPFLAALIASVVP